MCKSIMPTVLTAMLQSSQGNIQPISIPSFWYLLTQRRKWTRQPGVPMRLWGTPAWRALSLLEISVMSAKAMTFEVTTRHEHQCDSLHRLSRQSSWPVTLVSWAAHPLAASLSSLAEKKSLVLSAPVPSICNTVCKGQCTKLHEIRDVMSGYESVISVSEQAQR